MRMDVQASSSYFTETISDTVIDRPKAAMSALYFISTKSNKTTKQHISSDDYSTQQNVNSKSISNCAFCIEKTLFKRTT